VLNRVIDVALVVILLASAASAQTTNTNCTATSTSGTSADINCTSNTTTYGPTPAQTALQVERQKEMNENMSKMGASLGAIIAQKRAQHAQEKNELTAVVFCRQNPTGSWAFANKAPIPCATLEGNVVAYCTVNAKTPICKNVAKLPPASPQMMAGPDEQRVTINVVYCQQNPNGTVTTGNGEKKGCSDEIAYMTAFCTVHEWKGKPCEALSNKKGDAIASTAAPQVQPQPQQAAVQTPPVQTVAVSQPPSQVQAQPQQAAVATQPVQNAVVPQTQQMQNVYAIPGQEISVAEAARRNKAAKEAAQAKENPPPQP
jgi:hypothetical protein